MATEKTIFEDKDGNVVGIGIKTDNEKFIIPVADVRVNRPRVEAIEKACNIQRGSKYFKPSFSFYGYSYNLSMKGRRDA